MTIFRNSDTHRSTTQQSYPLASAQEKHLHAYLRKNSAIFFNAKERGHWLQNRQTQLQGTDGILHSSESQLATATHSMETQSRESELKKIKTETENSFVQDFKV